MAGCEKDVEVELSLGLGNSCQRESARSLCPGSVAVENGSGGVLLGCDLAMKTTAVGRTDEAVGEAALRRLEARKKQQVRRGVSRLPGNGGERQALKSDVGVVYAHDDDDDDMRVQKKIKADFSLRAGREGYELDLNKSDDVGSDLVPRFPMQYFPNANPLLYLPSGARELRSGRGYASFRPCQAAEKRELTLQNRKEQEEADGGAAKVGSCCSSAISETSRICSQGGSISSSDCGSPPSQVTTPRHKAPVVAAIVDQGPNSKIDEKLVIPVTAAAMANVSGESATHRRPALPFISLAQMPRVSTTGPGGASVKGFLYRYTREEVCIVCVCHGYSFSPAKFVEHAGGVDVENPLRQITVIPSAPATKF